MRAADRMVIRVIASLVFACGLCAESAYASTIILSGDTNTTDILVGGQGLPIDTGNQKFFTNLLQGGSSVVALENGGGIEAALNVNSFYNSLPGVSSTVIVDTVTDAKLAGADLFVTAIPDDAFTVDEITAMDNFLTGGGSIFFLGESGGGAWPLRNGYINDALNALGSVLSIVPDSSFGGLDTVTDSQIAVDPFTAGVTTFTYAISSEVDGGTPLFFGTSMQPFIAYEDMSVVPEPPPPAVSPSMIWLPLLLE